jgi:hypothetical protein
VGGCGPLAANDKELSRRREAMRRLGGLPGAAVGAVLASVGLGKPRAAGPTGGQIRAGIALPATLRGGNIPFCSRDHGPGRRHLGELGQRNVPCRVVAPPLACFLS